MERIRSADFDCLFVRWSLLLVGVGNMAVINLSCSGRANV